MAAPAQLAHGSSAQYLTFVVANEEYAVDLRKVREVMSYVAVTRVPMAPACIKGVVNVRGSVVPVIELATKFGMHPAPTDRFTSLVVVEVDAASSKERVTLSILVDSVKQVIEYAASEVLAPPAFGTPVHVDYLLGMLQQGERFVLLLDIDRILSTEELRAAVGLQESQRALSPELEPKGEAQRAAKPVLSGP